jgi:site-specific DNA recombinase
MPPGIAQPAKVDLVFEKKAARIVSRSNRRLGVANPERDIRSALAEFEELWDELFPTEQALVLELLVQRVNVHPDRVDVTLKIEGLTSP